MTPAQIEHLKRIDAHLANLLSTAEKRTAGEWTTRSNTEHIDYGEPIRVESNKPPFSVAYHGSKNCFLSAGDAAFIAACAGNAEAGWKTLRDEVREFIEIYDAVPGMQWVHAEKRVASILTAFPNV